jgi:hypothetical protein
MGFFRALLAGIKNVLSAMWDVFVWAVTLPARPFMPKPGRSQLPPAPDVTAAVRSAEASVRTVADLAPARTQTSPGYAATVMRWAIATARSQPATAGRISATLPAGLRTWTLSMTTDHARALVRARLAGISSHLEGISAIDGVPPVPGVKPRPAATRLQSGRRSPPLASDLIPALC